MREKDDSDGAVAENREDNYKWSLKDAHNKGMIYRGDLAGACGRLLADDTATLRPHGVRSYWLERRDDASALIINLGREFHLFTVVGPREELHDLSDVVRRALVSQGGIPA